MRTLPLVVLVLTLAARAHANDAVPEYRNVSLGAIADFAYGSSSGGDSLLGELGAEYVGIQSFRGHALLVQWDTFLAARGGIIANTLPYTPLAGAETTAAVEAGYRVQRHRRFSLYAGGRLAGQLSIMTRPGTSIGKLDSLNDIDGVGGVVARGQLRADVGVSMLRGRHSLLLVGFLQEAGYAPGVYTPGIGFTEGGIAVRYDLRRRLTASLEGLAGRSPPSSRRALDTTVRSTYAELSAVLRVILPHGIWLALSGSYGRQFDQRTYHDVARTYDTANAPVFGATLLLGIPFFWHHPY